MNFKTFSVLFLISVQIFLTECQNLCSHYKRNNYKMIVYSMDNKELILLIDKYFWLLTTSGDQLVFKGKDGQLSYLDNWNQFTTAFMAYEGGTPRTYYTIFYDEKREQMLNPFAMALFDGKRFTMKCDHGLWIENPNDKGEAKECGYEQITAFKNLTHNDIKESVSFRVNDSNGFVIQKYESNQLFNRRLTFSEIVVIPGPDLKSGNKLVFTNPRDANSNVKKFMDLNTIDKRFRLIGVFYTTDDKTYVLVRFADRIKYCALEKCLENEFQVLISCSNNTEIDINDSNSQNNTESQVKKDPNDGSSTLLIAGIISAIALIVILVLVIGLVAFYSKRKTANTYETLPKEQSSTDSSKTMSTILSAQQTDSKTN